MEFTWLNAAIRHDLSTEIKILNNIDSKGGKKLSTEKNKAIQHRFQDMWNKGDFSIIEKIFDKDFLNHSVDAKGFDAIRQFVTIYRKAFPDVKFTIEEQIAEGDKSVMRYTITGTHKGEFQGIEPTGKSIKITGIAIHRITAGKIVEIWANWDALGLMQQLGAVSMPGQK
jgi:steroid delta-isomerase-like uncharacterized protein